MGDFRIDARATPNRRIYQPDCDSLDHHCHRRRRRKTAPRKRLPELGPKQMQEGEAFCYRVGSRNPAILA